MSKVQKITPFLWFDHETFRFSKILRLNRLIATGRKVSKDKYGLSWQIIPAVLPKMMSDPDAAKSGRVMNALMQMKKLDIATLQRAYKFA